MFIGYELVVAGKPLKRFFFKDGAVTADIVQYLWFHDKKTTIDPGTISFRLLFETVYQVSTVKIKRSKSTGRLNRGNSGEFTVGFVISYKISNINISDSITVSQ